MKHLSDYFTRIGFTGNPKPTLETLQTLHQLHPATLPFENIDVLLNRTIDINIETIVDKMVHRGRGGYCFEHNGLLMSALTAIGFRVEPLIARVLWRLSDDAPTGPRTHMVLRVWLNNQPWLVDVGFGGLVLTQPLRFDQAAPQHIHQESYRLVPQPHGYRLEAYINEAWQPVYSVYNEPQEPIDLEVANWYTATHPDSKFRWELIMARATPTMRYTLLNNRLTVREKMTDPVQQWLSTHELKQVLEDVFLLSPEVAWDAVLQNAVNRSDQPAPVAD